MTPNNFRVKNGLIVGNNANITGYVNASSYVNATSFNVGTTVVANTTGVYATHLNGASASGYALLTGALFTGTVNATTVSVGTSFIANTTRVVVGTSTGLQANGGIGSAGQVLHSNGTTVYWAADDGITSIVAANGLSGGTITSTGQLDVVGGAGLISNSTGVHVGSANGISVAADAVGVTTGSTLTVNATGIHVNTSNLSIATSQLTGDVALGANTSGNYVATITNANGISGSSSAEGGTPTIGVVTGSTLTVNTTGIHVNSALSIASLALSGDITVSGNLTVSGTRTYVNTTTLDVGDNIITLNADLGASAPSQDAGIEIMRGTSANVQFMWDETNDRWSTNSQPLAISSLVAAGALSGVTTAAMGNTTITGFVNASASVNSALLTVGTSFVANTTVTTITDTTGLSGSTQSLAVKNGSYVLGIVPRTGSGAYNNLTTLEDTSIVVTGTSIGNANLAIVPWSGASGGLRMVTVANSTTFSIVGNTTITGFANVSGTITSVSGLMYANNLLLQGDGTNAYIRPINSGSVLHLGANNQNHVFVVASGNMGIGVSPSGTYGKLTVAGGIRTTDDTSSKLELGRYSAGAPNSYIKLGPNSSSLRISNAGDTVDLVALTNAGDFGIGTTTPGYKLEVNGSFAAGNTTITGFANVTSTLQVGATGALGGTATNFVNNFIIQTNNGNQSYLRFYTYRHTTGADWTSASTRIQQRIDVTEQGYIEFNPQNYTYGVGVFGTGGKGLIVDTNGVTNPTANIAMANNNITRPVLTGYTEHEVANAAVTGTYTMDCGAANFFDLTLTGNTTISPSNVPPSTRVWSGSIAAKQDATGGRTITWPTGTKYAGGVAPPATTTANALDIWSLMTYDGGTSWIVSLSVKGVA